MLVRVKATGILSRLKPLVYRQTPDLSTAPLVQRLTLYFAVYHVPVYFYLFAISQFISELRKVNMESKIL